MTDKDEWRKLYTELVTLRKRHKKIDDDLLSIVGLDAITIQRLKKKKLMIKDKILWIEKILYDDIIA